MADLSTLTDQERALLAQYLAVKSGGVGNAPALMQMVFDRLASGTFGSTLIEVIADLLPEGIPLGTDFSAYLPLVQGQGQPVAPPAPTPPVYGGGQGGETTSPGEPFDWSSFGARAPSRQPSMPTAAPRAQPAPSAPAPQAGQPAQTDDTGLFGFEMSPEIPPQADPGYLKGPNPLFPDLPRPDPRRTAALPSYDPGTPVAEPAPTARPTPINPPELPVLDPVLTGDNYTGPRPDERLVSPALQIDPTATDDPFRFIGNPRVGRLSDEYTPPSAPMPLRTTSVQPVSVNPQTGGPVDFGALLDTVLMRDLTGPLSDDADRAISALSVLAPALAPAQSAPLPAPGAGVSPQQRDAIRALPPDPFDITIPPPAPKPALDEWVLRDWIDQRGFDQQPAPESGFRTLSPPPQTSSKSLDGAPGRQAANTTYAPVPAPLPLARMAVAATLPEGTVQLSVEDRELLARAIATEVDPRVARIDPAAYQQQVYRTLDVMLNRVASIEFPNSVVDVLNQPRQFSAITGPRRPGRERYGDVQNIPEDRADPELRQMVENWIREREGGAPSSVGGALHYANPQAADASNMQWIMALDGPRDEAGPFSHWYGTTDGFTPTEAVLSDQPSWLTTKPQTPISTTAAVQAEKLRNKNSIDFNLAVQAAAAEQQRLAREDQQAINRPGAGNNAPSQPPFSYDGGGGGQTSRPPTIPQGSGGGGGSTSVGDPFVPGGGGSTTRPPSGNSGGNATRPSSSGGSTTRPSSSGGGSVTRPSSGGGGSTTRPSGGGGSSSRSSGGHTTRSRGQ